jgi:hypothetical protein
MVANDITFKKAQLEIAEQEAKKRIELNAIEKQINFEIEKAKSEADFEIKKAKVQLEINKTTTQYQNYINCTDAADVTYEKDWDNGCKNIGKEDDCQLPFEISSIVDKRHNDAIELCISAGQF